MLSGLPPYPVVATDPVLPGGCYIPAPIQADPLPGGVNHVLWTTNCPGPGTIIGKVYAAGLAQWNGAPVPVPGGGVKVSRVGAVAITALTASDGSFVLDPSPIGDVTLEAMAPLCPNGGGFLLQVQGRGTTTQDLMAQNCVQQAINLTVTETSAVPRLLLADIRITSQLNGTVYGGLAIVGSPASFPILADGGGYTITELSPGCTATVPTGLVATPGTVNLQVTVNCQ